MTEMSNFQTWQSPHGQFRSHDRVLYEKGGPYSNPFYDTPAVLLGSFREKGFILHGVANFETGLRLEHISKMYSRSIAQGFINPGYYELTHWVDLPITFHIELTE